MLKQEIFMSIAIDTLQRSNEITPDNPALYELARFAIEVREKQISIRFGTTLGKDAALIDVVEIMNNIDPYLVATAGSGAVKLCIEQVTRDKLAQMPLLMRDDTL